MCGLVGWISAEKSGDSFDRRKFIDQALILDTVRGGDSTGVFVVDHDKPVNGPWPNWSKRVGGGHEFVLSDGYQKLFNNAKTQDYKFCVGHNRSATIGGVNIDAAHPFNEGPITLVHNGTVNAGEVESQRYEKGFINDSQTICHMLTSQTPEEVVQQLDGAFALIWHDARDDSLNFVRNSQRPMHMAKAGGKDTIYFASEPEMLYWLDRRLTLKLQDIVSLKPAHLVKFTNPKLMVPVVTPVGLHVPKAKAPASNYQAQDWSTTGAQTHGKTNQNSGFITQPSRTTGQTKKPSYFSKHVPQQMQDDLLEFGLFVDEPQDFYPMSQTILNWHGKGGMEDASVVGWLYPEDKTYNPIPAVIHGLAPTTYPNNQNRVWAVIPMGVSYIGWHLPIVTCRVKTATCDTQGQIRSIPAAKMPPAIKPGITYKIRVPTPKKELLQRSEPADEPEFPGPNHRMLSLSEWLRATADGCGDCGVMLTSTEHAWGLEWIATDVGYVAICPGCIEDRIQNPDDDETAGVIVKTDPEGI